MQSARGVFWFIPGVLSQYEIHDEIVLVQVTGRALAKRGPKKAVKAAMAPLIWGGLISPVLDEEGLPVVSMTRVDVTCDWLSPEGELDVERDMHVPRMTKRVEVQARYLRRKEKGQGYGRGQWVCFGKAKSGAVTIVVYVATAGEHVFKMVRWGRYPPEGYEVVRVEVRWHRKRVKSYSWRDFCTDGAAKRLLGLYNAGGVKLDVQVGKHRESLTSETVVSADGMMGQLVMDLARIAGRIKAQVSAGNAGAISGLPEVILEALGTAEARSKAREIEERTLSRMRRVGAL